MEIEHWWGAVRRRSRLFLSVVLGALVIGALLAVVQQPVYKATAEVVIGQSAGANLLGTASTTPDLAAELKTARSDQVVKVAEQTLDKDGTVTVTADDASQTLSFEGTGTTGEQAADVANAHADAYVKVRQARATAEYQAAVDQLRTKISDIDDQLAGLTDNSTATQNTRTALQSQQAAYRTAVDQLEVAQIVGGTSGARVLTPAQAPSERSSPLLRNYLVYALLAGLLLGAGAVGVAEFLDRSIKDAEAARAAAGGVPVLGRVRHRSGRRSVRRPWHSPDAARESGSDAGGEAGEKSAATGVVLIDRPASSEAESHRSLRTTVQSMVDTSWPFLQVTSVGADDGSAAVAANLATALALTGEPTVLVCLGELRGIDLPTRPAKESHPLTALLTGKAEPTDCMSLVKGVPHLAVIARSSDEDTDDVARRSIGEALKQLQTLARTVILFSPPVQRSAVALEVADLVDGTVMVVQERSTSAPDLEEVTRSLSLMESPVLGIVLT